MNRLNSFSPAGHRLAIKDAPLAPGDEAFNQRQLRSRGETAGSIMLFEETVPSGVGTNFHLHRDSDEVAWVLSGEIIFKIGDEVTVGGPGTCAFIPRGAPHAWKNTSADTGHVLFVYTPATAGGFFEERLRRPDGAIDEMRHRHGLEIVGPPPF